jgi:hypothetical protein
MNKIVASAIFVIPRTTRQDTQINRRKTKIWNTCTRIYDRNPRYQPMDGPVSTTHRNRPNCWLVVLLLTTPCVRFDGSSSFAGQFGSYFTAIFESKEFTLDMDCLNHCGESARSECRIQFGPHYIQQRAHFDRRASRQGHVGYAELVVSLRRLRSGFRMPHL